MIQTSYRPGDLLFHSIHGLCRVKEIIVEKQATYYALVPKITGNRMSERFLIPVDNLEASGFHPLIKTQQANAVLDSLKGVREAELKNREGGVYDLAKEVLAFCEDPLPQKNDRRRQSLDRSVRGLVWELAIVLRVPIPEMSDKVRKNLERNYTLTTPILGALSHTFDF